MTIPNEEKVVHDWIIKQIEKKYLSLYKDIKTNPMNEQSSEFEGFFPDVILGSYGQVVQIIEVETESTITEERADYWKELCELPVQFLLLVPVKTKTRTADICWKHGLAGRMNIGTFELAVKT